MAAQEEDGVGLVVVEDPSTGEQAVANPNYVAPVLNAASSGRDTAADLATIQGIVNGWSATAGPTISWAQLSDAFQATLSAAAVTSLRSIYPNGVYDYVGYLVGFQ